MIPTTFRLIMRGSISLVLGLLVAGMAYAQAAPKAKIRLAATDASGNQIATANVGSDFFLRAYVQDIRPNPPRAGVFAAYMDVTYNPSFVIVDGPVSFDGPYQSVENYDTSQEGLINEVGAIDGQLQVNTGNEYLLWSVPIHALNLGVASFFSDRAEGPGHSVLVYGDNMPVPPNEVIYGFTSLVITVPEPASICLSGAGLLAVVVVGRRARLHRASR